MIWLQKGILKIFKIRAENCCFSSNWNKLPFLSEIKALIWNFTIFHTWFSIFSQRFGCIAYKMELRGCVSLCWPNTQCHDLLKNTYQNGQDLCGCIYYIEYESKGCVIFIVTLFCLFYSRVSNLRFQITLANVAMKKL